MPSPPPVVFTEPVPDTFYDRNRRPLLTGQAVYRGDRYQFAYALDGATAAVQVNAVP